jgi:hypothetical protein
VKESQYLLLLSGFVAMPVLILWSALAQGCQLTRFRDELQAEIRARYSGLMADMAALHSRIWDCNREVR